MSYGAEIGKLFRVLREQLGLNQTELAKVLGKTKNTIHNWEKNGSYPHSEYLLLTDLVSKKYSIREVAEMAAHVQKKRTA